ncbi:MAG: hypothetical protein ABIG63_05275 [Chloroflexota bacterium]
MADGEWRMANGGHLHLRCDPAQVQVWRVVSRLTFHASRFALHAPPSTLHPPPSTLHAPPSTLHPPQT